MPVDFGPLVSNEHVRETLRSAGWSPDREVDVSEAVDRLVGVGFAYNPIAVEILSSFHQIHIDVPAEIPGARFGLSSIDFRPESDAIDFRELVSHAEARVGSALFPIADNDDGLQTVLVAEDGQIYSQGTGQLFRDGADFSESLVRRITRHSFPEFLGGGATPWWIAEGLA
jgi:hypothetical protein